MFIKILLGICIILLIVIWIICLFSSSDNQPASDNDNGMVSSKRGVYGGSSSENKIISGDTEEDVINQARDMCNSDSKCLGFDTYPSDDKYNATIIYDSKSYCEQDENVKLYGRDPNTLSDICKSYRYFNDSSMYESKKNIIYTIDFNSVLKQESVTVDSKDVELVKQVPLGWYSRSSCYGQNPTDTSNEIKSYNTIVDNMNNNTAQSCSNNEDQYTYLGPNDGFYSNECSIGKDGENLGNISDKLEGWDSDETNNVLGASLTILQSKGCMADTYTSYVDAVKAVLLTFQNYIEEEGNTMILGFSLKKNGDDTDEDGNPIWNSYYVRFINPNDLSDKTKTLTPEDNQLESDMMEPNEDYDTYNLSDMFDYKTGCTNSNYLEFCSDCNIDDPSACVTEKVVGCMDQTACNYNSSANVEDQTMCEYAEDNADCDGNCLDGYTKVDGVCVPIVEGCQESNATNYNSDANVACDYCCEYDATFNGTTLELYDNDANLLQSFTPYNVSGQSNTLLVYKGVRYTDTPTQLTKTNGVYSNCSSNCGIKFDNGDLSEAVGSNSVLTGCDSNNWGSGLMNYTLSPYQGFSSNCSSTGKQTGGIYTCANFIMDDISALTGKVTLFGKLDVENKTLDNTLYRGKFTPDESCCFIIYANRLYGCTDSFATNKAPTSNWGLNSLCCNSDNKSTYKCTPCEYDITCESGGDSCECKAIEGCMDSSYLEYNPDASVSKDGACVYKIYSNNRIYK